jgi:hypothetical protein
MSSRRHHAGAGSGPLRAAFLAAGLALCGAAGAAERAAPEPAHWKLAPTPPMGWNSYDAFGSSVTEDEVLANARYLKQHLLAHGWNHVVVDFRWADATAADYPPNGIGGPLVADAFGRLMPAPNRFPSAAEGRGFAPLAGEVHALGLRFGIHVMRGIPRQSVAANTPIEGSEFRAADAADRRSVCAWCPDMWGIDAGTRAGQDWYDSIFRLYASWGVDYVKVDDLSPPYRKAELEAIRRAIDRCGRPMVLSVSPGGTPVAESGHVARHANLWRISRDFWDEWGDLDEAFDLVARWQGVGGPGRWPDFDMLPLGRIGIRSVGGDRRTRFTRDEQVTLVTLWALGPSPLMLGANLPDNDAWTTSLITNDEVLAVNQDPLGRPARRVSRHGGAEVWLRELHDGAKAVGLFNRGEEPVRVALRWSEAGLTGALAARDLWRREPRGTFEGRLALPVPAHGAALLRLSPAGVSGSSTRSSR